MRLSFGKQHKVLALSDVGSERVNTPAPQKSSESQCCLQCMFKIIFPLSWPSPWDHAISTVTED